MKNLASFLIIILIFTSCQYEPLDSYSIDNSPITESIKLESYYNQKSGIVFRWGDYRPDGMKSHSTNMGETKGWFAGGQSYYDINKDGFQDILVTYHSESNESSTNWYLNSGDNINFDKTNLINSSTIGLSSHKILKTDVNNDNLADFILLGVDETQVGNYGGNFTVLKQVDNGTFDVIGIDDGFGLWFHTGASGDLNGDGFVDVVGATYIWLGDGTGNFTNTGISVHDFGVEPALSYEILDINKDGYNDIVVGTQEAGPDMYGSTTSILFGKSNFGEYNVVSMPDTDTVSTLDLEFLDYDNDGDLDILELRGSDTNDGSQSNYSLIHLYINNNFTFTLDNDFYNESKDGALQHGDTDKHGWSRFKIDDIDNDGIDDIVVENYQDGDYNGLKKIGGEWKKYRF